jgi:hypothetical protein
MAIPKPTGNIMSNPDIELAKIAGFSVSEDTDQPGMWVWTREENGRTVEGCDMSFETEEDAWNGAIYEVSSNTMAEGDISSEEWDAMGFAKQSYHVRECYGIAPSEAPPVRSPVKP